MSGLYCFHTLCFLFLQVYWNYIKHMLTNLGSLSLERIHSMLGMFGLQGNTGRTLGLNDLTVFLNKKILAQQLVCHNNFTFSDTSTVTAPSPTLSYFLLFYLHMQCMTPVLNVGNYRHACRVKPLMGVYNLYRHTHKYHLSPTL